MTSAKAFQIIGGALFYFGLAALAGIFLIVLVNGHWPLFLKPVQTLFAGISSYIGGWALVVEGWMFLGPGLALIALGNRLQRRP